MNTQLATSLGDYHLLREAGRGAMSTVYEAVDTRDGCVVALKVLQAPATLPPEQQRSLIARLQREARIVARLSHPNIVRILEVGEHDGRHFLAMEYLGGTTLRARLDRGVLPLYEASLVLDQVAAALDAIHAQRIVHRDIKPSNVMLLPDGVVKLMDFGVARRGDDTTITQAGMIVGSPAYMSPEQIRGDGDAPPTDLWALGVLLYEMLAGQSPFPGANIPAVLYKVTHDAPAPIPSATPAVQKVLRRALDKSPSRRYQTAREFADALRATTLAAPAPDPRSRLALRPWMLAAALLAVFLAALLLTRQWARGRTVPNTNVRLATGPPALRRLPGVSDSPAPTPAVTIRERPLAPRHKRRPVAKPRPHKLVKIGHAAARRRKATKPTARKRPTHRLYPVAARRRARAYRRHRRPQPTRHLFPGFSPSPRYERQMPAHPVYNPQGPV